MNFSQALELMKKGKKLQVPRLSTNYIYIVNNNFFVYDGFSVLPIYGIKTEYLLAEDWEVINGDE